MTILDAMQIGATRFILYSRLTHYPEREVKGLFQGVS